MSEHFKKIGVVVADPDEYEPLFDAVKQYDPEKIGWYSKCGLKFFIGETQIVAVFSGVGKVNAAMGTMYLADNGCEAILNYGLSGGIGGVKRGQLLVPDTFIEYDFDLSNIGYKLCEKPGQRYIYSVCKALKEVFEKIYTGIAGGTAVCGDRFVCKEEDRIFLKEKLNAVSCDMETAAIAGVCDMAGIPFLSVRRVSDDAGDDAVAVYRDMNVNENDVLADIFVKGLAAVCKYGESDKDV